MTAPEALRQGAAVWGALGSLAWLAAAWLAARAVRSLEPLAAHPVPAAGASWPRLSVIVAACNEAGTLEAACRTLLAQDYPNLQIILVNDRSTDGTGEVVARLAALDPRVTALHVKELPAGWLGKTHALARGTEAASGEWLLFTDADVHFAPDALRMAIALAQDRQLDHLTASPDLRLATFPLAVMAAAFGLHFLAGLRYVQRPASKMAVGVGAFNLVRAASLASSEGFDWLKLEIADDAGLATVLKRAGARAEVASGHGLISLTWYSSARQMIRGLEKNLFGLIAGYRYPRALFAALAMWLYAVSPGVALAAPGWIPKILAASVFAVLGAFGLLSVRRFGQSPWPALFAPVGILMLGWAVLRSAWAAWRQGGIVWRGTRYDVATLRAGRRLGR